MKTAIKNRAGVNRKAAKTKAQTANAVPIPDDERKSIALDLIDFHPSNRRRFFNEKALLELAEDIAIHGLLHDIIVRPKTSGRYELLAGRRRTTASEFCV